MNKRSLKDLDCHGKKVLMRVDFNVPVDDKGQITDDTRIVASLPSIKYILDQGGSVVLMSHLGRPKGKPDASFSLKPCAERLSKLLNMPVNMAPDCVGSDVEQLAASLKPSSLLLLENLRFHEAEEKPDKDPSFAAQLAKLGDLFVNDAFGSSHRVHSSTVKVPQLMRGRTAAGFLLEKEIEFLGNALKDPKRPFVAILGGAKISTKLGVIQSLLEKVDTLLIGGAMAFTFLKAQGVSIGLSLYEEEMVPKAKAILESVKDQPGKLLLPTDLVVANAISPVAEVRTVTTRQGIPPGYHGVDIGPATLVLFSEPLRSAETIFWNGPLGVFEIDRFAKGTREIAKVIADTKATSIVGGGDSVAALQQMQLSKKISHLSTGGGASLEYIEQGSLPGIEAL